MNWGAWGLAEAKRRKGPGRIGGHMRIRRQFTNQDQSPYDTIEFATTSSEIRNPDGSVVFFLSDERDPDFWEEVREHYQMVRYTDYPQLTVLLSQADGRCPDNSLLYAVETEIMRSARKRIESMPGYRTAPHSTLIDERTWSFCFLEVRRTLVFRTERRLRGIARRIRRRVRRYLGGHESVTTV